LHWVRKTLKRTIALALTIAVPAYAFLLLFAHRLLHLWVGNRVAPTLSLLAGLALYGLLTAIGNCLGTFLNAAGIIKLQASVAAIMAGANLALSIVLTHRLGVSGPVWGSVISYSVISLVPLAIFVPRLLRSMSAQSLQSVPHSG
jgi:O-antigen/teichoic acid export membrane protein